MKKIHKINLSLLFLGTLSISTAMADLPTAMNISVNNVMSTTLTPVKADPALGSSSYKTPPTPIVGGDTGHFMVSFDSATNAAKSMSVSGSTYYYITYQIAESSNTCTFQYYVNSTSNPCHLGPVSDPSCHACSASLNGTVCNFSFQYGGRGC